MEVICWPAGPSHLLWQMELGSLNSSEGFIFFGKINKGTGKNECTTTVSCLSQFLTKLATIFSPESGKANKDSLGLGVKMSVEPHFPIRF